MRLHQWSQLPRLTVHRSQLPRSSLHWRCRPWTSAVHQGRFLQLRVSCTNQVLLIILRRLCMLVNNMIATYASYLLSIMMRAVIICRLPADIRFSPWLLLWSPQGVNSSRKSSLNKNTTPLPRLCQQWWNFQHVVLNTNNLATHLCVNNSWACKQTTDKQNQYR